MDEKKTETFVGSLADMIAGAAPADIDANLQITSALGECGAGMLGFGVGQLVAKVGAERADVLLTQFVAFLKGIGAG